MAWNGSGSFNRTQDFTADLAAGAPSSIVSAAKVDDEFDNFKAGLQATLARDGQNSPSANINWGGYKITNHAAPSSGGDVTNKTYVDAGSYIGSAINGLTAATVAATDLVAIADVSDSNNPKKVTAQSIADLAAPSTPVGAMMVWPAASAPTSWLLCYGQSISRTTYAGLFAIIGTTFGAGDGSTTFGLPDLRGRSVFGKDDMGGSAASRVTSAGSSVDGATLGAVGGSQLMQQHNHTATVTDTGHTHGQTFANDQMVRSENSGSSIAGQSPTSGGSLTAPQNITESATTGISVAIANTGSGTSQNMPPAIVMNWIIKVL